MPCFAACRVLAAIGATVPRPEDDTGNNFCITRKAARAGALLAAGTAEMARSAAHTQSVFLGMGANEEPPEGLIEDVVRWNGRGNVSNALDNKHNCKEGCPSDWSEQLPASVPDVAGATTPAAPRLGGSSQGLGCPVGRAATRKRVERAGPQNKA